VFKIWSDNRQLWWDLTLRVYISSRRNPLHRIWMNEWMIAWFIEWLTQLKENQTKTKQNKDFVKFNKCHSQWCPLVSIMRSGRVSRVLLFSWALQSWIYRTFISCEFVQVIWESYHSIQSPCSQRGKLWISTFRDNHSVISQDRLFSMKIYRIRLSSIGMGDMNEYTLKDRVTQSRIMLASNSWRPFVPSTTFLKSRSTKKVTCQSSSNMNMSGLDVV
jgi:hypothetical protein